MSFVYESVPSEDVERVAKIAAALKWHRSPTSWVIDRERDAFMACVSVGTKPDFGPPGEYALVWEGHVVRVEAYVRDTGDYPNNMTCIYDVMFTDIPDALRIRREEVLELRDQALHVKGRVSSLGIKNVVVNEMFPTRTSNP